MTKIKYLDTYLNKESYFYVNRDFSTIEEVYQNLRIKDYLYYKVIAVSGVSCLKAMLINLTFDKTGHLEDVFFEHYKLLMLDE